MSGLRALMEEERIDIPRCLEFSDQFRIDPMKYSQETILSGRRPFLLVPLDGKGDLLNIPLLDDDVSKIYLIDMFNSEYDWGRFSISNGLCSEFDRYAFKYAELFNHEILKELEVNILYRQKMREGKLICQFENYVNCVK